MKKVAIIVAVVVLGVALAWYRLFAFTTGPVEFLNQTNARVALTQQIGDERVESSIPAGLGLSRMSRGLFREPLPSVIIRHQSLESAVERAEFEAMLSYTAAHIVVVVIEETGLRFVTLDAKRNKTPIQPPQQQRP